MLLMKRYMMPHLINLTKISRKINVSGYKKLRPSYIVICCDGFHVPVLNGGIRNFLYYSVTLLIHLSSLASNQ